MVASNEPEWCKMNLPHTEWNIEFASDFYPKIGGMSREHFDFVILSKVDYSINNSGGKVFSMLQV